MKVGDDFPEPEITTGTVIDFTKPNSFPPLQTYYERQVIIKECWDAINAQIKEGDWGFYSNLQRNGMVMAANILAAMMGWGEAKYAEDIELDEAQDRCGRTGLGHVFDTLGMFHDKSKPTCVRCRFVKPTISSAPEK